MQNNRTIESTYDKCLVDGMIVPQAEIEAASIESMLKMVEEDQKTVEELKTKNDRWNTLYKLNYDVLRTLCEALTRFDKVKILNHQCLFAYVCFKHPELELDWDFFERVRTKRNGIQYYGTSIIKEDYKQIELQMFLYIKLLKKEVERLLGRHD